MNFTEILVTFVALISLLEPLSTLSFYARLHPNATPKDYLKDGVRIGLVVFLVLTFFFFVGTYILQFFGLEVEYFRIAGGLILFFVAFSMIKGEESDETKINKVEGDGLLAKYMNRGLILPLTVPLSVSPIVISYVISSSHSSMVEHFVAIFLASITVILVISFGGKLIARLGEIGTHLIIRFFGLFLFGVAIQVIIENIIAIVKQNFF